MLVDITDGESTYSTFPPIPLTDVYLYILIHDLRGFRAGLLSYPDLQLNSMFVFEGAIGAIW